MLGFFKFRQAAGRLPFQTYKLDGHTMAIFLHFSSVCSSGEDMSTTEDNSEIPINNSFAPPTTPAIVGRTEARKFITQHRSTS
jgi:hypothetical protein